MDILKNSCLVSFVAVMLSLSNIGDSWAGCYKLYDESQHLIYSGSTPPFDISLPNNSFGIERDQHLVIDLQSACPAPKQRSPNRPSTDVATAEPEQTGTVNSFPQKTQPNPSPNFSSYTPPATSTPSSSSDRVYVGPRGGRYVLKNGKKRYLPSSKNSGKRSRGRRRR